MEPRDEAILFIMKFRRNLIIKEIIKCLALSIILVLLTYSPMFIVLFKGDNNPFFILIFGFIILYLLFFKSQIKRIKDNILIFAEKELEDKIKEENKDEQLQMFRYKKLSKHQKILNSIRIKMFDN